MAFKYKDKVSVVMLAKNELDSIKANDLCTKISEYTNDFIVMDGNSSDGTREYCQKFTSKVYGDSGFGKGTAIRSSINKVVQVEVPLIGDVKYILKNILIELDKRNFKNNNKSWWSQIDQWKSKNSLYFKQSGETIKPQHAVKCLYDKTKKFLSFTSELEILKTTEKRVFLF